jgi:hypothetical protein
MRGTVLYAPRDIRFVDLEPPKIVEPTDAVIRIAVTCVCGSDLWPYRGLQPVDGPTPMGHEYCGTVEEVGRAVRSVKPGQFVIGSFATSDNTCPNCRYGYQSSCVHREFITRAQAPALRVPLADGTLVPTPGVPPDDLPYFRPNNNATRGQISKIVSNAAGFFDPPGRPLFWDVSIWSPFYTYTNRLASRGIISGYPCGGPQEPCIPPDNLPYFRPNNNATRGQTSKIVANTFFPDCEMPARK